MLSRREAAAIQTDAYIDALLASHAGVPVLLPEPQLLPEPGLRRAVELLERGLPRVHPSFIFEEQLASRLRSVALSRHFGQAGRPLPGQATHLPGTPLALPGLPGLAPMPPLPGLPALPPLPPLAATVDRRLLLGGAIASGVSLAGAAMLAWRLRERGRPRRRWLA